MLLLSRWSRVQLCAAHQAPLSLGFSRQEHWSALLFPSPLYLYSFSNFLSFSTSSFLVYICGFPGGSDGKESTCSVGDLSLIPGLGRSPGEGNGYSPQYSSLENSMDRGAWRVTVHGVAKSWIWLNDFHFTLLHSFLNKLDYRGFIPDDMCISFELTFFKGFLSLYHFFIKLEKWNWGLYP